MAALSGKSTWKSTSSHLDICKVNIQNKKSISNMLINTK